MYYRVPMSTCTAIATPAAFPAGSYVAVDPAEVLPEADWRHIVFDLLQSQHSVAVSYSPEGAAAPHSLFVWTTKAGDGIFPLYHARTSGGESFKDFCGDVESSAGLLCIAPLALLGSEEELPLHCAQYFSGAAVPAVFQDGDVRHGDYEVITSDEIDDGYQTQPYVPSDEEEVPGSSSP